MLKRDLSSPAWSLSRANTILRHSYKPKFSAEFLIFAFIGILNTALHTMVVAMLVEFTICNQVMANALAFCSANILSFFLNCKFTFKVSPIFVKYLKFLSASMVSFALTIMLASVAEFFKLHYLLGLAIVIAITPIMTFALQKRWTFEQQYG